MKADRIRGRAFAAWIAALSLVTLMFAMPAVAAESPDNNSATAQKEISDKLGDELAVIDTAIHRNHITDLNLKRIVYAIRITENGSPGNEFGVQHPRAADTDLNTQAGWAAATVAKNYERWLAADRPGEFITYLGDRYCPPESDPDGNATWASNVRHWYDRFGGTAIQ